MTVAATLSATPAAHASDFGVELNGTYRVTRTAISPWSTRSARTMPTIDRDVDTVLELCQPDRMRRHGDEFGGLDRPAVVRLPEHLLGRRSQHPRMAVLPRRGDRPRRAEVSVLGIRPGGRRAKHEDHELPGRPPADEQPQRLMRQEQAPRHRDADEAGATVLAPRVRSAAGLSTTWVHVRRRRSSASAPVRRASRTVRCSGRRAPRQPTVRRIVAAERTWRCRHATAVWHLGGRRYRRARHAAPARCAMPPLQRVPRRRRRQRQWRRRWRRQWRRRRGRRDRGIQRIGNTGRRPRRHGARRQGCALDRCVDPFLEVDPVIDAGSPARSMFGSNGYGPVAC